MHQNNVTVARVNSTQACAACKYQRRKCPPDCILAPYFPHDRQRQFHNAHKLFGVSNITKIIRHLDQPEKDAAMRTIIFQSDVRASDPVGGCYRLVRHLQRQIDYAKAELDIVLRQLALCRAQAAQANRLNQHHQILQLQITDDNEFENYDISSCLDPIGSNELQNGNVYQHFEGEEEDQREEHHVIIQSENNNNNNNNDVSNLQEFSDSWGMQGGSNLSCSNVHVGKEEPSPSECNDFKAALDFDLKFDYEDKIEHR